MTGVEVAYGQVTGRLELDAALLAICYSGHGEGKNNPAMQSVRDVGPIPVGLWRVAEVIDQHPRLGPCVLRLEPCDGTETYGRTALCVHGDDIAHPGCGSDGCICAPRPGREVLAALARATAVAIRVA